MIKRIKPKAGQESVWDYPRPPALERTHKRIRVVIAGKTIADTTSAFRVLETSHPPVYYLPREDISMDSLMPSERPGSFCEWKGKAVYWDVRVGDDHRPAIAWSYPGPNAAFGPMKDYIAFYPGKVDEAWVDAERVQAQEGDFYGGWITSDIVGPFKGARGTWGW